MLVQKIGEIFVLTILLTATSLRAAEDERSISPLTGDEHDQAVPDCTESILLTETRSKQIFESEEDILASPEVKCEWTIVGHQKCRPSIKCTKFKLTEPPRKVAGDDDPCPDEYLEIMDGSNGYQKFCGDKGPDRIVPPGNLHDLFVRFRGHKNPRSIRNKGFKCTVTCADGGRDEKPLQSNTEPEVNNLCDCGKKKNDDRIVGGEDAGKGEFPWIVALVTAGTRKPFCGGTLIANQFIVTAAHCFKGAYVRKDRLEVLSNAHTLDVTETKGKSEKLDPQELARLDAAEGTARYQVAKYFTHPLYVRQTNDFDIAVIKLSTPVDFQRAKNVGPVCIPSLGRYDERWDDGRAVVAGWGLNNASAETTMATLQKLDVTVFSKQKCSTFFDERFNHRMLCAGYEEGQKDACKGDSGGPLIAEKGRNTWQLIGAVSWGEGCAAKRLPGVYSRISELNQWIRYIVNKEDGVWCLDRGD